MSSTLEELEEMKEEDEMCIDELEQSVICFCPPRIVGIEVLSIRTMQAN